MKYEVYHVGNLARDRLTDPDLDKRAEEYLERATPLGMKVRPGLSEDVPRGRGEGFLMKKRLWGDVWEYRFYPVPARAKLRS